MKLLLTGATGYLGRRVAAALAGAGHQLSVLVRTGSDTTVLAGIVPATECHVVEKLDLNEFLARHPCDGIIHLAACYGRNGESLQTVFAANCVFPLQLLLASSHNGIPYFINAGTSLPPHLGAYALSKGQFAEWGRLLGEKGEIAFLNLSLEHFYGPDDAADKFVTRVIRHCLSNEAVLPLTEGLQRRDFIYIDDVAAAFQAVVEKLSALPRGYQSLGVGSGTTISIREMVEMIRLLSGASTRLDFGAVSARPGEPEELKADIRALRGLGWDCVTGLRSGLLKTIAAETRTKEKG